ncbi:hypothetical protein VPH35_043825 [Triticum aestivum]
MTTLCTSLPPWRHRLGDLGWLLVVVVRPAWGRRWFCSLLWRCSCSSAPWCVSARRCPAATPVAHRCRGAVSASYDRSNVPPTQLVSRPCAVLVAHVPFDCVDGTVPWFGLLGDALRLCWWHAGVVTSVSVSCDPSNVPHDTGGVAALCSLGCAKPFDCVDGAVSWFGFGWLIPFDCTGGALCLFCVVFPSLFFPLCVVNMCCFALSLLPCASCISGSLEPYLATRLQSLIGKMNTIQVGGFASPGDLKKVLFIQSYSLWCTFIHSVFSF